ncbi:M23 family metallopeptidase [Parvularcula sp. IMCC14364]|uniref:M23 family metallopeptidase n=1 Tax=Parvularcula sp. IMCC14364 TaxID=3067902 RepID=UPI00274221C3|nr:M23 family metallopeptidase [Parvularcula sp. IMCC14364]
MSFIRMFPEQISARRHALLLAAAFSALALAGTPAAATPGEEAKVTSSAASMKDLMREAGLASSTQALGSASLSMEMKVAQLDTSEIRPDGGITPPTLAGDFAQGGLIIGQTQPGSTVMLDDMTLDVDGEGRFIFGFNRDHPETAILRITYADGTILAPQTLNIEPREFKIERIDGLPDNKVNAFTPEEEQKIVRGIELKKSARANMQKQADWTSGFDWPVKGRISGVFGSQRILNGVPRRFHSGVDVAAPTGTDLRAPADGIITLAEDDMYFEGGLVFIDHGQGLESALMHMSRVDVEAGQRVSKGDIIGAIGATGRATGPHMHWSLKWRDRLLDAQLVVPDMADEG